MYVYIPTLYINLHRRGVKEKHLLTNSMNIIVIDLWLVNAKLGFVVDGNILETQVLDCSDLPGVERAVDGVPESLMGEEASTRAKAKRGGSIEPGTESNLGDAVVLDPDDQLEFHTVDGTCRAN